jgi:hypothetical protein
VDESVAPVLMGPANPVVAGGQVENGISQSKETDQTTVVAISDKESESAAEALGNGN